MSEGTVYTIGQNIITTSPYTIYQAGILASIITGDVKYLFFTFLAITMGDGLNIIEKMVAKKLMKAGPLEKMGERPNGCGVRNRKSCTGCGIYPSYGKSSTWGMPSGHAQITAFAAMYWTLYVWMQYRHEEDEKKKEDKRNTAIAATIVVWFLAMVVWTQRVYSKCHSPLQVGVGAFIGAGLGVVGYIISAEVFDDIPKLK